MNVTIEDLNTIRAANKVATNQDLVTLYDKMTDDLKPKITDSMLASSRLIIEGNTVEEAAEILGVSKVAVSQSSVKGLNRLAEYWIALGGNLPNELELPFNMISAKKRLDFFVDALNCYENPQRSLTW